MKYVPSINIEYGIDPEFEYIVTPNALAVTGNLLSSYNSGIHSFSIIGTYGTGKSSYLMALEKDLTSKSQALLKNKDVFGGFKKFECLNILGDYNSLSNLLADKLGSSKSDDTRNVFDSLNASLGEGVSVYRAVELWKSGKSMEEVYDILTEEKDHVNVSFTVNDLNHLQRGGRVSKTTAVVGSLVNIKPILTVTASGELKAEYAQKCVHLFMNNWLGAGYCGENYFTLNGRVCSNPNYTWGALLCLVGIESVVDLADDGRIVKGPGYNESVRMENIILDGKPHSVSVDYGKPKVAVKEQK